MAELLLLLLFTNFEVRSRLHHATTALINSNSKDLPRFRHYKLFFHVDKHIVKIVVFHCRKGMRMTIVPFGFAFVCI